MDILLEPFKCQVSITIRAVKGINRRKRGEGVFYPDISTIFLPLARTPEFISHRRNRRDFPFSFFLSFPIAFLSLKLLTYLFFFSLSSSLHYCSGSFFFLLITQHCLQKPFLCNFCLRDFSPYSRVDTHSYTHIQSIQSLNWKPQTSFFPVCSFSKNSFRKSNDVVENILNIDINILKKNEMKRDFNNSLTTSLI